MRKTFYKSFFFVRFLLTAFLFASCSQANLTETSTGAEETADEVEMKTITISANENPVSRTSYEDSGDYLSVKWKEGDVIYVGIPDIKTNQSDTQITNNVGFYTFTIESISDDGKTAKFTGEIPAEFKDKKVLAFYGKPQNIFVTTDNKVKLNFATQNWNFDDADNHATAIQNNLSDYDFMAASAIYDGGNNLTFDFNHKGAVLRYTLSGLPENTSIDNLTLTTTDGSKPFISYLFIDTDGNETKQTTYDYLKFNSFKKTTTDSNGSIVLYRTVCPTSFTCDNIDIAINFSLEKGDYIYKKTLSNINGTSFEAGKFYTIGSVGSGITLQQDNTIKGAGTDTDPYIIDNPEKLLAIAQEIKGCTTDNYNKVIEISRNIDMTGYEWTPIGNITTPGRFNGTIRGKTLQDGLVTISGIDYVAPDGNMNAAFLSYAHSSSKIQNLKISGNFTGKSARTAGIVAQGYKMTIENCEFEGTVNSECSNNEYKNAVGGIVGFTNMGTISNCRNYGNITIISSTISTKNNYCAGIAGIIQTSEVNGTATVNGCTNYGTIKNDVSTSNISGIVGNYYSSTTGSLSITDCALGEGSVPADETLGSVLQDFSNAGDTNSSATITITNGETTVQIKAGEKTTQYPNQQQ